MVRFVSLCATEYLWGRQKHGLNALYAIKLEENPTLGDLASIQLYKVQQTPYVDYFRAILLHVLQSNSTLGLE